MKVYLKLVDIKVMFERFELKFLYNENFTYLGNTGQRKTLKVFCLKNPNQKFENIFSNSFLCSRSKGLKLRKIFFVRNGKKQIVALFRLTPEVI